MQPYLVGLTGNMGSGKSTIVALLAQKDDIHVIKTDDIGKHIIADPNNAPALRELLGEDAFVDGVLNSPAVSKIIFNDESKRRAYEGFVHPRVWQAVQSEISKQSPDTIVVIESALIFELGVADKFNCVVVVEADLATRLARLQQHRDMSFADITARQALQISQEAAVARADLTISTDCLLEQLPSRIEILHNALIDRKESR